MALPVVAQAVDWSKQAWSAKWIAVPGASSSASSSEYGVYHFRRTLEFAEKPRRYLVHVTADNRYQLFVNGQRVSWGPARGDLFHWRYESVDLTPYLTAGKSSATTSISR